MGFTWNWFKHCVGIGQQKPAWTSGFDCADLQMILKIFFLSKKQEGDSVIGYLYTDCTRDGGYLIIIHRLYQRWLPVTVLPN